MKEFLSKKNVVLVKKGTKIIGGKDTGQPCLIIGVAKKVSKSQLKSEDLIPQITDDGQVTDIVIQKPFKALNQCYNPDPNDGCPLHTDKIRPMIGGISIGRANQSITGTGGLLVRDATDDTLVFLTNNHVIALIFDPNYAFPFGGSLDPTVIKMIQPSLLDGGSDTGEFLIGWGKRCVPIQFGSNGENRVDAGIIDISTLSETMTDILHKHAGPFEFLADNEINPGDTLEKSGRSTGNASGNVSAIDVAANVNYINEDPNNVGQFVGQIHVETVDRFSMEGDSGAVCTRKVGGAHRIAGLLFAGSEDGKSTLVNPMGSVAAELQIAPWDGNVSIAPGAFPVLAVHYRCYNVTTEFILGDASHIEQTAFASCAECLTFQFKRNILGNVI
jgi:hypothetical protein